MLEITWHLCKWQQQQTALQLHFTKHHRCNICANAPLLGCLHIHRKKITIFKKSHLLLTLRARIHCATQRAPYPQMTLQLMMIFFFKYFTCVQFPFLVFLAMYFLGFSLFAIDVVVSVVVVVHLCRSPYWHYWKLLCHLRQPWATRKTSAIVCVSALPPVHFPFAMNSFLR